MPNVSNTAFGAEKIVRPPKIMPTSQVKMEDEDADPMIKSSALIRDKPKFEYCCASNLCPAHDPVKPRVGDQLISAATNLSELN